MKLPFGCMREPYSYAAYSKERMIIAVNTMITLTGCSKWNHPNGEALDLLN
jgi:hypothetical protein